MNRINKQLKGIFDITRYSIRMFFRDKSAVYFSLFIPLLIMTIFGLLNLDRASQIQLGIVDNAKTDASKQVVEGLKKVDNMVITEGAEEAEVNELKKSNRDLVLVLPEDFAANLAQFQMQRGSNIPATVQSQGLKVYTNLNSTNGDVQVGLTILDKVFDGFTHQATATPVMFTLNQESVATRKLTYVDFIVPGVAAMSVMQMSLFGVVGAIVSWREKGILKRLLATPIQPGTIIFSQVFTRLIITLMQVSVLIGVGVFFFKLQIVGSLLLVYLLAILGGIVFLTMGLAISGLASTQNSVMAVANLIMMPQMFLSGVFFPREALPEMLNRITTYFPLTYLSHGMREVMINGASIYQVRSDILGLMVWGIIVFFLSSRYFRWE